MSSARVTYDPYPEALFAAQAGQKPADAPYLVTPYSELAREELAIALIGPNDVRREAAAGALAMAGFPAAHVQEFRSYPPSMDSEMSRLLDERNDVILIDLDSNVEVALDLVESICAFGTATVMVYSNQQSSELLMRCMRSGAREFLPVPFAPETVAEALVRVAARQPAERRPAAKPMKAGKMLVFMGAKGGVGVTSVACNYAVALAQDTDKRTILIDLDLPLGDAALNLGIVAEFSTVNALQEADRLDASFLSRLLVKHSSGLSVLAAPGRFPNYEPSNEALAKLIAVARQEFDYVVVDVGSRLSLPGTALYSEASTVYLVTQAGIPELRNSNRLISQVFANHGGPRLEVVLNRYESRTLGVSEEHINKALTRPAQWKIPNDHGLMRKMQIIGAPLVLDDNALAKTIRDMALSVNGPQPVETPKKKGFSFFG